MKKITEDILFELQFNDAGELFITPDSRTEIKLDLFLAQSMRRGYRISPFRGRATALLA